MKTLKDAKPNENLVVLNLKGDGALRRRIMDMGITKGCNIFVRKFAPFGDPIELNVRGYELFIRKDDAEKIIVENVL